MIKKKTNIMKLVKNKLRVVHIPQIPMEGFCVEVLNEREAYLVEQTLANQHLFLYEKGVIPDYSNIINVEMQTDIGWEDYYNDVEDCSWDEFCEQFEDYLKSGDIKFQTNISTFELEMIMELLSSISTQTKKGSAKNLLVDQSIKIIKNAFKGNSPYVVGGE